MLRDHRTALGAGAGKPIAGLALALYDECLLFGETTFISDLIAGLRCFKPPAGLPGSSP